MTEPVSQPNDVWLDMLGIGPEEARFLANLESFRSILDEIKKLRTLDLTDIQPAVVFDPTLPYRMS